jgi:hypothetical protein
VSHLREHDSCGNVPTLAVFSFVAVPDAIRAAGVSSRARARVEVDTEMLEKEITAGVEAGIEIIEIGTTARVKVGAEIV